MSTNTCTLIPFTLLHCFLSQTKIAAQSHEKLAVGFGAIFARTRLFPKHFTIWRGQGVILGADF